ncbi:hypothetical protein [Brachybacterium huguangmaarense]
MSTLAGILVVLHILCWAVAFGCWFAAMRSHEPNKGMAHGASGAVVFGLILMILGIAQGADGHMFYGLKLLFAIIAMACSWIAVSRGRETNALVWYLIPVSIVANIVIGVFHIGA